MVVAFLLVAGGAAVAQMPGQILMDSDVYPEHSKGLVDFPHEAHVLDYGVECRTCHHVYENGKNVWEEGDEVQPCDACHSKPRAPRGGYAASLTKEEKIETYHYYAIHELCKGCHQDLRIAGKTAGPIRCRDCHPRN